MLDGRTPVQPNAPVGGLGELLQGREGYVWRGIRDDFANFLRAEQCLELARMVG